MRAAPRKLYSPSPLQTGVEDKAVALSQFCSPKFDGLASITKRSLLSPADKSLSLAFRRVHSMDADARSFILKNLPVLGAVHHIIVLSDL